MISILRFRFIYFILSILFVSSSQNGLLSVSLKPFGYEDIVALAKPKNVVLSSDGSKATFVVRQGHLEENRNSDTLYLWHLKDNLQEKLFATDKILQTTWSTDGNALYFLVQEEKQYKIICSQKSKISVLISSADPILLFALSPDELSLYYTIIKSTPEEVVKQKKENGYVFEWGRDTSFIFLDQQYKHNEREEICCLDMNSSESQIITSLPRKDFLEDSNLIISLQISEDRNYLLIYADRQGDQRKGETAFVSEIIVWDIARKKWCKPLSNSPEIKTVRAPCWISPTQFIFQETAGTKEEMSCSIWSVDIESNQLSKLDWITIPKNELIDRFFFDKTQKALYGLGWAYFCISMEQKSISKIKLPDSFIGEGLSLDRNGRFLGTIVESSNVAPEVLIYDIVQERIIHKTDLNPQLANLQRATVEKIQVATKDGLSTTGYLVHPVNKDPTKHYPIIIATYGFSGKFIADAEWHSSFPAQTLAGEGYVVLLLNGCGFSQNLVGNVAKAQNIEGWNMLTLFEKAVDIVVERGLGDPTKVGLYGWSHGAFMVNFLISHSQKFHVACIGEGGDYNPGMFWIGGHPLWPRIFENMFGGPPWGATLKNYLQYAPFFQVDKISTPVLFEFASQSAILGLEMYAPLRYRGIPAEFVAYDGEEHNFVKPKARVASMARKLEWFNFWLLNKRDPHLDKLEQYERWDRMHEEFLANGSGSGLTF